MLEKELIDILACPECKGPVQLVGEGLVCEKCKLLYPVRDGIPVMLLSEAIKIDE